MQDPVERDPLKAIVSDPLLFLDMECDRLRLGCVLIDKLARRGDGDPQLLPTLITFIRVQVPMHLDDESEDLFPLLRLRARRDDDIAAMLGKLSADHPLIRARLALLAPLLEGFWADQDRATPLSSELAAAAAQIRQHLALLNAVVLPIARLRLIPQDLMALSQAMISRRAAKSGI